jgi:Tfp pilus assembly protein PilF
VQAPNYGERAQVILKIGLLCEQAGRVRDAIASYERALAAAPDYPDRAAVRARIDLLKSKL